MGELGVLCLQIFLEGKLCLFVSFGGFSLSKLLPWCCFFGAWRKQSVSLCLRVCEAMQRALAECTVYGAGGIGLASDQYKDWSTENLYKEWRDMAMKMATCFFVDGGLESLQALWTLALEVCPAKPHL